MYFPNFNCWDPRLAYKVLATGYNQEEKEQEVRDWLAPPCFWKHDVLQCSETKATKEVSKLKASGMGRASNRLLRDKCAKVGSLFKKQDSARLLVLVIRTDSRNQAKAVRFQRKSKPRRQGPVIAPFLEQSPSPGNWIKWKCLWKIFSHQKGTDPSHPS